jgi:predicted phosphodiesterase
VILCAAGDIHGGLDRMYAGVLAFEAALGVRVDWVLHVGDFGVWPDPTRVDGATRRHEGAGDFPTWFAERRAAPRPTVFIKGNHEDFVWLDAQPSSDELLARTRPRVCFFGHHHTRVDAEIAGVPCVGLNKGHYPGCLVAFEMKPGERAWRVLGEWPPKPSRG